MTDNEIIKALECHVKAITCRKNTCIDCPLYSNTSNCSHILAQYAFDLINRQKAEIEKYRHIEQTVKDFWSELKKLSAFKNLQEPTLTELLEYIEYANAEAVKEFAERLKRGELYMRVEFPNTRIGTETYVVLSDDIDNLVKEMTEQRKEDEGK